jgi:hypothetical protein
MPLAIRMLALPAAAAVLVVACSTDADARPPTSPEVVPARPIATAGPPAPVAVPGAPVPPPDAQGNPACPTPDAWGKAPTDNGIFVTYWGEGIDYVTALISTTVGADVAKSAAVDPSREPLIFDFPRVDPPAVTEVLMMTNVARCYATPDPATSGR